LSFPIRSNSSARFSYGATPTTCTHITRSLLTITHLSNKITHELDVFVQTALALARPLLFRQFRNVMTLIRQRHSIRFD
jgi:hypothetical protein